MNIESEIREFVIESLGHTGDPEELTDSYPLIETGIVDSMGMLELILWVEKRHGIQVHDEDVLPANFGSVTAIANYIRSRSADEAGAAGIAAG